MADSKPAKKVSEGKKVFDVAKPNQVPAAPTSRPIIVGHGASLQQDPMVVDEEAASPEPTIEKPPVLDKPKREINIEPPKSGEELPSENTPEEEIAVKETAPEEPKQSAKESATHSDAAAVDVLADAVSIKREQEEALEKEAKANEEVEKLIASRQYFVKIKTPPAKRNLQIIIIFALLILAVAGWYLLVGPGKELWAKSEPAPADQAVIVPAATPVTQTQATAPTVREFFDTNLGVGFKYPTQWGDAKVADNSKNTTEKGKRIFIEFSNNSQVTAGMKSKDWADSSRDVNAHCKQPGFTVFVLQKTQKDNGLVVISEKPDSQIYEELTGGLCNDLQIIANKKFAKNNVYTGLEIWYQAKTRDTFDLAQRIEDYKKQPDTYFTKQLRDQMTAVIESTKEL